MVHSGLALDISEAADTSNHDRMLQRAADKYGVIYDWLKSY